MGMMIVHDERNINLNVGFTPVLSKQLKNSLKIEIFIHTYPTKKLPLRKPLCVQSVISVNGYYISVLWAYL